MTSINAWLDFCAIILFYWCQKIPVKKLRSLSKKRKFQTQEKAMIPKKKSHLFLNNRQYSKSRRIQGTKIMMKVWSSLNMRRSTILSWAYLKPDKSITINKTPHKWIWLEDKILVFFQHKSIFNKVKRILVKLISLPKNNWLPFYEVST